MPRLLAALAASAIGRELASLAAEVGRYTVQVQSGSMGEGSGVLWRSDGLVVTNAHVARTRELGVRLSDSRTLGARLVARDPERDLALLQLTAPQLSAAPLGDVAALRPGELVVALGHPFGVPYAASVGVVHHLATDGAGTVRWIRADIRLAPGNSGGPLVDISGRVLGINTLVAGGLGYAIPATVVARFVARAGLPPSGERAA